MGYILIILKWVFRFLKSIFPIIVKGGFTLTGIWTTIKTLFAMSGTLMLIGLEPTLEVILEMITGIKGPVTWFIQLMLNNALNYLTTHLINVNPQAAIDSLYASQPHLMQYCCYIGLTAALQLIFDGIINGMATILNIEMTVLAFKIKTSMFLRMR
ncbi:MAG TPA: hypothetical protein VMR41_02365 [Patescibacteria group bacterium]|nr:hypothetical protein [Patescibacteria group bacterium]